MKRVASLAVAVALALGSQPVLALGLGQIQVRSALGQPLLAEIPVRFDNPQEMKSLHLGIASPAAYQRAGISTNQMGIPLQFDLTGTPAGGYVIRVTTADPVRDPYVDFLLDASWSDGSLVREYTILLDPPGFNSGAAASQAPAAVPAPSAAVTSAPAPAAAPPAAAPPAAGSGSTAAPPTAGAVPSSTGTYIVRSGDTAYGIASRNLPAGVSIDQMLRALQLANPRAFIHGNVNELRSGAILRLPSAAAAQAIPAGVARAAVRAQTEAWQARAPQPLLNASAVAAGAPSAAPPPAASGRLELVPPGRGSGAATRAGVAGGTGNAAIAGIKQKLDRAQEALASEKLHAADLKSRIEQLQKINTDNARLLALKNNEIAQLQARLAQLRHAAARSGSAAPAPVASVAMPAAIPAPAPANRVPAPAASASPAQPAAKPAIKPAMPAAARTPAVRTPFYQQPRVLAAAGIAVLLGLLGLLWLRRRRASAPAARVSLADSLSAVMPGAGPEETGAAAADADGEEARLQGELQQQPDDLGLYLELASLQYARGDAAALTRTAEAMQPHVFHADAAEWQAVLAMGAELAPAQPLFQAAAAAPPAGEDAHGVREPFGARPEPARTGLEPAEPDLPAGVPEPQAMDAPPAQGYEDPYAPLTGEGETAGIGDPVDTKLDLARAYLDMGDYEGARAMLDEVLAEGSELQKDEAQRLLDTAR